MTISYVSSVQAASTTVSMPTHVQGDFIMAWAFSNDTGTQPTMPSGQGWTLRSETAGFQGALTAFYKFADSASESFGTSTGAEQVIVGVYRGINKASPLGVDGQGNNPLFATTTWAIPTISFDDTSGTSWMVAACRVESGSPSFYR
jgi:hypothetical protein